jgi:biopolymer transport protein ExbD
MNLEQHKEDEDIAIDMSPMIDMVFLLLIFFVVASVIVDNKVPVTVPSAFYAKVPEDITGRFIISINKNEELFVGLNKVTMDELKGLLATAIEADPELRIMIRADGGVKYKLNEEVMMACADVGAVDMIFSAFEQ